jgi:hypothetical protein
LNTCIRLNIKDKVYLFPMSCDIFRKYRQIAPLSSLRSTTLMADTLEPIVIPPLKVDRHFTCAGSGLLYEDQERVSADSLRTLLLPSNGRNGISDRDRYARPLAEFASIVTCHPDPRPGGARRRCSMGSSTQRR